MSEDGTLRRNSESSHAKGLEYTHSRLHAKDQFIAHLREMEEQVSRLCNDTYFLVISILRVFTRLVYTLMKSRVCGLVF